MQRYNTSECVILNVSVPVFMLHPVLSASCKVHMWISPFQHRVLVTAVMKIVPQINVDCQLWLLEVHRYGRWLRTSVLSSVSLKSVCLLQMLSPQWDYPMYPMTIHVFWHLKFFAGVFKYYLSNLLLQNKELHEELQSTIISSTRLVLYRHLFLFYSIHD